MKKILITLLTSFELILFQACGGKEEEQSARSAREITPLASNQENDSNEISIPIAQEVCQSIEGAVWNNQTEKCIVLHDSSFDTIMGSGPTIDLPSAKGSYKILIVGTVKASLQSCTAVSITSFQLNLKIAGVQILDQDIYANMNQTTSQLCQGNVGIYQTATGIPSGLHSIEATLTSNRGRDPTATFLPDLFWIAVLQTP